jgi:CubicO group peptidase (beta-lactamase class C family)
MRALILGTLIAAAVLLAACPKGGDDGQSTGPRTVDHRAADPGPEHRARPVPARVASPAVQLAKATQIKTARGATFLIPARWYLTRRPHHLELRGPEKEMWLVMAEVQAANAKAAITRAWNLARPSFAMKEKSTATPPASGGWDSVTQITYVTPSKSQRVVLSIARGKGKVFYVTLLDTKIAALSRRGAQFGSILSSLKAPGVADESWAGKKARVLDKERLATLATFLESTRKQLQIPGAAIAIVQGGKVIYKKGFGTRRLGTRRPVTTRTLFMIGSITKSLTTMMMAKLVDEKRFDWDTPVTKVLPSFALGDAKLTRQCKIRHTVCACTGLPRQDMEFLFESAGTTAQSRMALLKTMKPTTAFGETFQYSNLMVAAGGYVAAHAAYPKWKLGKAYARAMQTRLFKPARMRRTTFDFRRVRRLDHAQPHSASHEMKPVIIPMAYEDGVRSVGPAGALWSNVEDMARFVLLELGRGKVPGGRRVVSAKNLQQRWKGQIKISSKAQYGLAVMVNKSRGVRILGHGGGTLGFSSNMMYLPDHDIGMIVLSNRVAAGRFTRAVTNRLLELIFDGKPKAARSLAYYLKELAKGLAKSKKRMNLKPDAKWVKRFAGVYHNAALGTVKIAWKQGAGVFDAGEWKTQVARRTERDGVEKLVIGPPLTGLPFLPGKKGPLRTLTLHTGQQKYVFVEKK